MVPVEVALGGILCAAGFLLITVRPKASPLLGRALIGVGALLIAAVLWQIAGKPTFRPDK